MEVLYHKRPYFGGISSSYTALTWALYMAGPSNLGSYNGHWFPQSYSNWSTSQRGPRLHPCEVRDIPDLKIPQNPARFALVISLPSIAQSPSPNFVTYVLHRSTQYSIL